ncbi:uncharacterized protein LOC143910057 isoform X2 [Arctopsyche grandis]|uniref:uncharacterized protein LOC143910057 isoform X2 n=1 Tax=Arctopsyche grandis TaxID=121162 RepID=UPI00406D9714
MERLSHDLNLALEESNCGKQGRKKFGLRRRTRSTGNLPASCVIGIGEDGSSSSPHQPAIVSNVLSDSDDPQLNQLQQGNSKNRSSHFCPGGNFESDSFNENFSPAKPPNARRKRKFKKMAIDYPDTCNGKSSPPLIMASSPHINVVQNCSVLNLQGSTPFTLITKKKRIFKHGCQDGHRSNMFCGKRKWSHRERSELGEMRERSFSGGCASKSYFCGKSTSKSFLDFKNSKKYLPIDKVPKFKDKFLAPVKNAGVKNELESALQSITLSSFAPNHLPGSSSFNFVYRPPATTCESIPIFGKPSDKPLSVFTVPSFALPESDAKNQIVKSTKKHDKSHGRKHKSHHKSSEGKLRNPLQFDDPNIDMDCSITNEAVSSSSISSSDSEGVVTNDSDREGDDELTDWPGNEEISSFNKNLNIKVQKPIVNGPLKMTLQQIVKPFSKKEKFLPKLGLSSCKNKTDTMVQRTVHVEVHAEMDLMDDDTMMSNSGSVLDTFSNCITSLNDSTPLAYTSFADVKNAGLLNNNANEAFFHSFQALQDTGKLHMNKDNEQYIPRTNFTLQKTSSSDLNLSEKSPQSDHCYSEHSACFGTPAVRKLRAGCRRLRDERPGFAITSAANEQLSRFLQDSCQDELKLPCFNNDQEEREKLASLAKLYSLDMSVELGRPVLRKTSNTTQSVRVEHSRLHCQRFLSFSKFKRRCYDPDCTSEQLFALPLDVCQPAIEANKQPSLPIDPEINTLRFSRLIALRRQIISFGIHDG